jgi:hypothetical protein
VRFIGYQNSLSPLPLHIGKELPEPPNEPGFSFPLHPFHPQTLGDLIEQLSGTERGMSDDHNRDVGGRLEDELLDGGGFSGADFPRQEKKRLAILESVVEMCEGLS